jgi:hypothetical protein
MEKNESHATVRRRGPLLIALGLGGLVLGTVVPALLRRSHEAKPSVAPTFVLSQERATSAAMGITLTVPAPWVKLEIPAQAGIDFAFQHPNGIRFAASTTVPEETAKVDPTLQLMLDNKRKQYGELGDVKWGDESIATLTARTLAFTIAAGPTGPARTKVWLVTRGRNWATFHCGGPELIFVAGGEKLCRQVLDGAKLNSAVAAP